MIRAAACYGPAKITEKETFLRGKDVFLKNRPSVMNRLPKEVLRSRGK